MNNYPIVLDANNKPLAILHNAYEVYLKDQLLTDKNGFETLEFKVPAKDLKRLYIDNESNVRVKTRDGERDFIIRVIEDDKVDKFTTNVVCDATWYDLNDPDPISDIELDSVGPAVAMATILQGTGWSVGTVEITVPHDFNITEPASRLQALRKIPSLYGGELYFRTADRKVDLLVETGDVSDIVCTYEKNTPEIKRISDTRNLITRMYLVGAGGITIASVNGGVDYIENYSWYDSKNKARVIKSLHHKDERFSNPNYMKQWMAEKLTVLCKPATSYTLRVSFIDGIIPNMGDYIAVFDKDLDLNKRMRVVGRNINILEPERSEVTLDTPLKSLADQLSVSDDYNNVAGVTDAINQAISDVSMFNLLFNSRADDGFNYWVNQGFDIDNTAGVSGSSAFSAVGALGVEKSVSQTIDVANRDAYTISAEVDVADLVKGPEGQLGFEITFEYEDETTDTQFIAVG